MTVVPDKHAPDGVDIKVSVEPSNNAGVNLTEVAGGDSISPTGDYAATVSPAMLLVTEMMIMAGEAIGKWKIRCDEEVRSINGSQVELCNSLLLPFRSQAEPGKPRRRNYFLDVSGFSESLKRFGACGVCLLFMQIINHDSEKYES